VSNLHLQQSPEGFDADVRWCFQAAIDFYTTPEGEEDGMHDMEMRMKAKHMLDLYEGLACEFLSEVVPRLTGNDEGDGARRKHRELRDKEIANTPVWFMTEDRWAKSLQQDVLRRLNSTDLRPFVKGIFDLPVAELFPDLASDYVNKVGKAALDLRTVRDKLTTPYDGDDVMAYRDLGHFASDVRWIWKASQIFNSSQKAWPSKLKVSGAEVDAAMEMAKERGAGNIAEGCKLGPFNPLPEQIAKSSRRLHANRRKAIEEGLPKPPLPEMEHNNFFFAAA